jgi:hypothetical protein
VLDLKLGGSTSVGYQNTQGTQQTVKYDTMYDC